MKTVFKSVIVLIAYVLAYATIAHSLTAIKFRLLFLGLVLFLTRDLQTIY